MAIFVNYKLIKRLLLSREFCNFDNILIKTLFIMEKLVQKNSEGREVYVKKLTRKVTINNAMHVIKCPDCGAICASASEREFLPEFTTCDYCASNSTDYV